MNRRFSVFVGVMLVLVGSLGVMTTLIAPILGWRLIWWPARLWPVLVFGLGLVFVLAPFLMGDPHRLSPLFLPGVPVLTTGVLLLFTSVLNIWGAWAWLWPLEVLAVAVGFAMFAFYARNVWLLIPAIIVGTNGLLFLFCAVTGWWGVWAVLWGIEPLSVGLALLAVYLRHRRPGLLTAGLILCGVAAFAIIGMTLLLSEWWLLNLLGPAILVLVGLLLLVTALRPRNLIQEA